LDRAVESFQDERRGLWGIQTSQSLGQKKSVVVRLTKISRLQIGIEKVRGIASGRYYWGKAAVEMAGREQSITRRSDVADGTLRAEPC
jgi:hypothetical protein